MTAISFALGFIMLNLFTNIRIHTFSVCVVGGLIGTVGMVISIFSSSISMMIISFGIVTGIGASLCYIPTLIMCNYWFKKRRAFANGKL